MHGVTRRRRRWLFAASAWVACVAVAMIVGCSGGGGDDVKATELRLREPAAVAVDSSGAVYVADTGNCSVHRIIDGRAEAIVGRGTCGGDLQDVNGLAVDPAGVLYLTDSSGCRILRWDGGDTTTVAGDGTCGFSGDGGPATEARLDHPAGLAIDGNGNLYIADARNCRVRQVSGGTITTVAGRDGCGFEGDGGPAVEAALDDPVAVAVGPDGTLYIVESVNCVVRKVVAGVITTLAGDGTCAFGEPVSVPAEAGLGFPRGVAAASDGRVFVADTHGCRVLAVAGDTVTIAAGDGACAFAGDAGPAAAAGFDLPTGIAVAFDGTLYIADTQNCRIRRVSEGRVSTLAGRGCE